MLFKEYTKKIQKLCKIDIVNTIETHDRSHIEYWKNADLYKASWWCWWIRFLKDDPNNILLDQVCSKFGDEDNNRALYDTMMQSFNSLKAKTENMIHKLDNEVDYTRSLEEKLKCKNIELDNIQLRKALLEEQRRMTLALEDFQKKMDEPLNSITNSFTSMDKNISDNCTLLQ